MNGACPLANVGKRRQQMAKESEHLQDDNRRNMEGEKGAELKGGLRGSGDPSKQQSDS